MEYLANVKFCLKCSCQFWFHGMNYQGPAPETSFSICSKKFSNAWLPRTVAKIIFPKYLVLNNTMLHLPFLSLHDQVFRSRSRLSGTISVTLTCIFITDVVPESLAFKFLIIQIYKISFLELISALLARMHKDTASQTFSTLERSWNVWWIAALLKSWQ